MTNNTRKELLCSLDNIKFGLATGKTKKDQLIMVVYHLCSIMEKMIDEDYDEKEDDIF